jgi:hypothetical protein
MRRGYDPRIQEKGEKLDDRIHVKEQDDFFSACMHTPRGQWRSRRLDRGDEPTAVYLLLICKIMIMVMRIATMWTKHVAVSFQLFSVLRMGIEKKTCMAGRTIARISQRFCCSTKARRPGWLQGADI